MTTIETIQPLINDALDALATSPDGRLAYTYRRMIYQALNPKVDFGGELSSRVFSSKRLKITPDHYAYSYLAILSAEYVLPLWEHGAAVALGSQHPKLGLPRAMLTAAKGVINRTVRLSAVLFDYTEDYAHLDTVWHQLSYPVYWAGEAAYAALGMVLGEAPLDHGDLTGISEAALAAEMAYATTDLAWPYQDPLHKEFQPPALQVDRNKRVAFWQWWLTDALPTAWAYKQ